MLKWNLLATLALVTSCSTIQGPAIPELEPEFGLGEKKDATQAEKIEVLATTPMPSAPLVRSNTYSKILFASCSDQKEDQSIWSQLAAENPDLVLLMGDNVYGDVRSMNSDLPELREAYHQMAQSVPFAELRATAPMIVGWDDHDYGLNDAGKNFKFRKAAEELFEEAWALEGDDPQLANPGVYGAWVLGGEDDRRVQILNLDTRFFRSDLIKTDEAGAKGKERYVPDADPSKTMLGKKQWAWLAAELEKPADLRIIVSSVQVIADGHGWEGWKMLPTERAKLYETINASGAKNVMILSGDRHSASFYERDDVIGYPLFEATSSSLNKPASDWRVLNNETYVEPGPYRTSDMIFDVNYGLLEIDWEARSVAVNINGADGETILTHTLQMTD